MRFSSRFPLVFLHVSIVIPILIRLVVIIRRDEKCENFTKCGCQRKRGIEKNGVSERTWCRSSRNFKRYLVFLRPLKSPSTGLLCTFRLFKANRSSFLRKSRENRSMPRSTAADFGNKNIRERSLGDEKLIAKHFLYLRTVARKIPFLCERRAVARRIIPYIYIYISFFTYYMYKLEFKKIIFHFLR